MALEPPRVGTPEQDDKPKVSVRDRLVLVNQHVTIINDIQFQISAMMRGVAISGQDAVKLLDVDGEPKMTEEQYAIVAEGFGNMVTKLVDIAYDLKRVVQALTETLGRTAAELPRLINRGEEAQL